jgi:IS5 family transposase
VDNADGVILDHNVEIGNPADAPQLAPAIERIARRTGRAPRAVTADRGYGEAGVERDLHDLGVRSIAIPRKGKTGRRATRVRTPKSLPREGQMAHRIRRPDQPHQTQLRLEPHRTHHHHRRPNLVRTRRLRPQPHQDRSPGSVTSHTEANHAHPNQSPAARPNISRAHHHDNRAFFRSK